MNLNPFSAWRPPQWNDDPLVSIVDSGGKLYVFDAVFKADHRSSLRVTEHPVQTGANISDHAYQLPETLTLEIGMSDAMDSYDQTQWKGYYTEKSVNAFQKLKEIQYKRLPITVTTRLNTYRNMMIVDIATSEELKTLHGLKSMVYFKQIFSAQVKNMVVKVSDRPNTTNSTPKGNVQVDPGSALFNIAG